MSIRNKYPKDFPPIKPYAQDFYECIAKATQAVCYAKGGLSQRIEEAKKEYLIEGVERILTELRQDNEVPPLHQIRLASIIGWYMGNEHILNWSPEYCLEHHEELLELAESCLKKVERISRPESPE